MAAIYQKAHVVISADMSPNSRGGFLEIPRDYREKGTPVAFIEDEKAVVYARTQYMHGDIVQWQPIAERAWTLQEGLLASRLIHFTDREMIWRCQSGWRCECTELDHGWPTPQARIPPHVNSLRVSRSPIEQFNFWYQITDAITKRGITNPMDLLPCLSGLAKHFQDHGAGMYLAGVWAYDLPRGLLWFPEKISHRMTRYRAPSWSWASFCTPGGPYHGYLFTYCQTGLVRTYASVLDAYCIASGKDPLGAIAWGRLIVSAPVIELNVDHSFTGTGDDTAWARANYCRPEGCIRLVGSNHAISRPLQARLDYELNLGENEPVYCLFVGESFLCTLGLLLRRYSAGEFERIGFFSAENYTMVGFIPRTVVNII